MLYTEERGQMNLNKLGIRTLAFLAFVTTLIIFILGRHNASAKTWYVDDSGVADFIDIQGAVDNATSGDIIMVKTGTYDGNLIINKSLTLRGNGSENTIINRSKVGCVVTISADRVNMSGFTVSGSGDGMGDAGIDIESSNNHLFQMNCSSNNLGILVTYPRNKISDSSFWNNYYGIDMRSSNNSISNSTFSANYHGLHIFDSYVNPDLNNNTVVYNLFSSNNYGIYLTKTSYSIIANNIVSSNDNKGIYLVRSSWIVLDSNTISTNENSGINLATTQNCFITNNIFSANNEGITLTAANYNHISNNTIKENTRGIFLLGVINNSIRYNTIIENRVGISLSYLGDGNIVHHNLIYSNIKLGIDGIHANSNKKVIDAHNNWWGSEFGPYHPESNWNGRGDTITDNVDFDPWIGKEITVKYVDDDAQDGGDGSIEHPFNEIQDGIDEVVEEGTVFVLEGHYYERVRVNKTVYLFGNSSLNTIIDGEYSGIPVLITAENIRFSGFACINSGDDPNQGGITIYSDSNRIYKNNCSYNSGNGIRLFQSNDNRIYDNIFSFNGRCGASIEFSDYNALNNNTLTSNGEYGINIFNSKENRIANGGSTGNLDGIRVTSNSIGNHIMSITCKSNIRHGFYIEKSGKNIISDSFIMENGYGITFVQYSKDNIIYFNNIYNNLYYGIDASKNYDYSVTAVYNWWGKDTGPYHPLENPNIGGENVTDFVEFDPWIGKSKIQTLFVNDDAPDGGDGSLDHPFNDIQIAVDAANKGDTVRFMEGTYQYMERGVIVDKQINLIGTGDEDYYLTVARTYNGEVTYQNSSGTLKSGKTIEYRLSVDFGEIVLQEITNENDETMIQFWYLFGAGIVIFVTTVLGVVISKRRKRKGGINLTESIKKASGDIPAVMNPNDGGAFLPHQTPQQSQINPPPSVPPSYPILDPTIPQQINSTCHACGYLLPIDVMFCWNCGMKQLKTWQCPSCKIPIDITNNVCTRCGTRKDQIIP